MAGAKDIGDKLTSLEIAVSGGASLSDVKEILGHSDLKMTMRYAHLSPAHLRRAVDKLDGLTSSAGAPDPGPSRCLLTSRG